MDVQVNIPPAPVTGSVKASIPARAYDQLDRERALTGWPIAKLIARFADHWERSILALLTSDERQKYFAKELSQADYEAIRERGENGSQSVGFDNCRSEG